MTKSLVIYKLITRQNQQGVEYLIRDNDTDVVKQAGVKLKGDDNPLTYGNTNIDTLFSGGDIVINGLQVFESIENASHEDVYKNAFFAIFESLADGGDLGDMAIAVNTVYSNAGLHTDLITDFYDVYRLANTNDRHLFDTLFIITLNGLINNK